MIRFSSFSSQLLTLPALHLLGDWAVVFSRVKDMVDLRSSRLQFDILLAYNRQQFSRPFWWRNNGTFAL
jgi:hypothetical protein